MNRGRKAKCRRKKHWKRNWRRQARPSKGRLRPATRQYKICWKRRWPTVKCGESYTTRARPLFQTRRTRKTALRKAQRGEAEPPTDGTNPPLEEKQSWRLNFIKRVAASARSKDLRSRSSGRVSQGLLLLATFLTPV